MTPTKHNPVSLSAIEVAAICVVVAAVTFSVTKAVNRRTLQLNRFFSQSALAELSVLDRYGPERSSQNFEEWAIRDFFSDRRGGVFLDVGANHYQRHSNTYYLEVRLGWSGVAIEPQQEFAQDYAAYRPRTRFIAMFASDTSDEKVQLFVPENSLVASSNRAFADSFGSRSQSREVPTTTLNVALDRTAIGHVDFMSMDIELAEPKALAGFDIERFKPALVCIEGHAEVRQQILDYFARHRYVLVGKYLRIDPHNLYFTPDHQEAGPDSAKTGR